jgi:hypothetical protein
MLVTVVPASTANAVVVPKFTWGWDAEAATVPEAPITITAAAPRPSNDRAN